IPVAVIGSPKLVGVTNLPEVGFAHEAIGARANVSAQRQGDEREQRDRADKRDQFEAREPAFRAPMPQMRSDDSLSRQGGNAVPNGRFHGGLSDHGMVASVRQANNGRSGN